MHTNTQACTHCAQGWWPSVSSQPSCLFHLNAGMWLLLLLLLCNCSQMLEPPSCHRQWESERGDERREIELWGKGIKKKKKKKSGRPFSSLLKAQVLIMEPKLRDGRLGWPSQLLNDKTHLHPSEWRVQWGNVVMGKGCAQSDYQNHI